MRRPAPIFVPLAVGAFALGALGRAASSETFLDGVTYAAIARNMAIGVGSFWRPSYTALSTPFYQHPPLGLWLESLAFRAAGDRPWVELWWGLLLAAATLALVPVATRAVHRWTSERPPPAGWAPLLLALAPLFGWSAANNMLENTLSLVTLSASVLLLASVAGAGPWRGSVAGLLGGAAVFLGLMTKGPPALFVLAQPLLAALLIPAVRGRRALVATLAALAGIAGGVLVARLLGGDDFVALVRGYVADQLGPSARGQRELAPSRWLLAWELAKALAPPALAALLAAVATRGLRLRRPATPSPEALLCLATGLAGALPFLAFPKQMAWYLVPSLPFWAMSLAILTRREAVRLGLSCARRPELRGLLVGVATLAGVAGVALAGPLAGSTSRSLDTSLRDAWASWEGSRPADDRQSEYAWSHFERDLLSGETDLPPGARVTALAPYSLFRLNAYMARHFRATLTPERTEPYVIEERTPADPPGEPVNCRLLQRHRPRRFFLYRCTP